MERMRFGHCIEPYLGRLRAQDGQLLPSFGAGLIEHGIQLG
jgi:hypothetical protein